MTKACHIFWNTQLFVEAKDILSEILSSTCSTGPWTLTWMPGPALTSQCILSPLKTLRTTRTFLESIWMQSWTQNSRKKTFYKKAGDFLLRITSCSSKELFWMKWKVSIRALRTFSKDKCSMSFWMRLSIGMTQVVFLQRLPSFPMKSFWISINDFIIHQIAALFLMEIWILKII